MTAKFLKLKQARRLAMIGLLGSALAGCSAYNSVTRGFAQYITPYRITIVQGNFVSQETAAKLHVGMTREEVRSTLGTPLLADMFHASRWDYLFYFKRGNRQVVEQRDLTVYFDSDKLARWTGANDLPSELELLSEIDGDRKANTRSAQRAEADAATVQQARTEGAAGASAAAVPQAAQAASNVPANQTAASTANRATAAGPTPASGTAGYGAPPAVANSPLQGPGGAAAPANSQFRLQAPTLRRGGGNDPADY